MFQKKMIKESYDKENKRPVPKCSICNGEQVAGFKDVHENLHIFDYFRGSMCYNLIM